MNKDWDWSLDELEEKSARTLLQQMDQSLTAAFGAGVVAGIWLSLCLYVAVRLLGL